MKHKQKPPYSSSLLSQKQAITLFMTAVLFLLPVTYLFATSPAGSPPTFLPVIFNGDAPPFTPTTDTQLPGGAYIFSDMIIPVGVTVTVLGDVSFQVRGQTDIAGTVVGDCTAVTLRGQGDVTVTGTVDNHCAGDDANAGDLIIYALGSNLALGTVTTPAMLDSSGNIDISNNPSLPEWEFEVLPHQLADTPTPPVCAADADTLVDTAVTGFPIEVAFAGSSADPDGGPMTYAWDFDDGNTATEQDPRHNFAIWGVYDVTLTATDDEGDTCVSILRLIMDDGDTNAPAEPGVWQMPTELVVGAGEAAVFQSGVEDPNGESLTYLWDFGDSITATVPAPTHTYTLPGVYAVTLSVTNEAGFVSTATSAIYVYDTTVLALAESRPPVGGNCTVPGPNVFNVMRDAGKAAAGRDGRALRYRGQGNIFLGSTTAIKAQDGGDGTDRTGSGDVMGGRGGQGGSLYILVRGNLTLCTGASLSSGSGGEGGDASSTTPAAGMAWAKGGNGGRAAKRLWIVATQGITIDNTSGGTLTINPGDGGAGGAATAVGEAGDDMCNTAEMGASAKARGGNGGRASKTTIISGNVVGVANITLAGGLGGDGGSANATGGAGGAATCPTTATGGLGRRAEAIGGSGGNARLGGAGGFAIDPAAFTAGDGGTAEATGGDGGLAVATPSAPCEDTTATGGNAGLGTANGGRGGQGRIDGAGGDAAARGGDGGDATATGGDCPGCGNEGGSATATSGLGGDARSRFGRGQPDGAASATGGAGGLSTATGGKGGDCDACPGGAGGPGGPANADGRDGGDATGNGSNTGGNGGDTAATGGEGGKGADCFCGKFIRQAGGDGGDGGSSTTAAGDAGDPGGLAGVAGIVGGDGGNGGEGEPAGAGGAGGIGTGTPNDIPDGLIGLPGPTCPPVPVIVWYIYHSSIPDGTIIPPFDIPLNTYTTTVPINPTGSVLLHFMDQDEVGFPPNYIKNLDTLFVNGGLRYQLADLPPTFPIITFQATVQHSCANVGCVQIMGYSQGVLIGTAVSQETGPGSEETITLPETTLGQTYDEVVIISVQMMSFNHWGIIIVDP